MRLQRLSLSMTILLCFPMLVDVWHLTPLQMSSAADVSECFAIRGPHSANSWY